MTLEEFNKLVQAVYQQVQKIKKKNEKDKQNIMRPVYTEISS